MSNTIYRRLDAWKKGIQLTTHVYAATASFPRTEAYGLTAQMRSAAVSILSNIAEGRGRTTRADFRRFVVQARGSAYELETQIEIARQLGYVEEETAAALTRLCSETLQVINGLLRHLSGPRSPAPG